MPVMAISTGGNEVDGRLENTSTRRYGCGRDTVAEMVQLGLM
jgi:hypothetical protein